ncbi:MAG: NAD(P)H-hydrate dehydratase [Candidatus ainarchaeum sp.]|nr:NAD(P)H-hydrate dehydratase [Candidatus ainarchaeum sp.]
MGKKFSLHKPQKNSHKGQNGKLLIIGGSAAYSGSALFSILAARRFVDLLYFYPTEACPFLIQATKAIPEAIVVYDLEKIAEADCVLFGGGMGGSEFNAGVLGTAKKVVLDAEGFNYVPKARLDSRFILTPHKLEFERYFGMEASEKNIENMAKKHHCTILRKGTPDVISDGRSTRTNEIHNQGMTKGGTGDVLAGLVAALYCTNPAFESAFAGARINGIAGNMLLKEFGFNFCASDLASMLPKAYAEFEKGKYF